LLVDLQFHRLEKIALPHNLAYCGGEMKDYYPSDTGHIEGKWKTQFTYTSLFSVKTPSFMASGDIHFTAI